ncbi:MAG: 6,7-dimethyl-8-ribityllumazine synthase [Sulfurimicrobium sp.]|nr:6,7-dimethyl-8-ribityllumazine synthase [Sulfurimicrobium sp.]MDO9189930.1 6,7-dimethyl-8-ribityllumazine synthase [Sulfurimicrobium sp.]MDP1704963.1 6,7-dimethyl-8-ribityllumazine synthase [Sulfurimicrobium sp.]MDP1898405.1 6,7-dimethyl-8-ribityllumazine synthase [Sulfurimicrobium sp.]MDP2198758.1 6,7-dimethyl-8-ribityllumazine synthase [Sulfurimicrobium sp.]
MGTPNKLPECHPDLNGAGLKIGIAMSRFNIDVCEGLLGACVTELLKLGVAKEDIFLASVPGALEISLVLQKMAKSGKFDALVALGAIIRGETYHFELVANESGSGVTRVMLDSSMPIANAILTVEDDEQALVRMSEKGADAARVVVEMVNLLKKI